MVIFSSKSKYLFSNCLHETFSIFNFSARLNILTDKIPISVKLVLLLPLKMFSKNWNLIVRFSKLSCNWLEDDSTFSLLSRISSIFFFKLVWLMLRFPKNSSNSSIPSIKSPCKISYFCIFSVLFVRFSLAIANSSWRLCCSIWTSSTVPF